MIFPWQANEWQQVIRSKKENRLPHALLLTGISGIGKTVFADHFCRFLLCQKSEMNRPLCQCHACCLLTAKTHPDVLWIEPEKEGAQIKVDQIREVSDFINQTSLQGDKRIVIIRPADEMNISAANALLKTLEEPTAGSFLLLITHQEISLPATILSRCQRILFTRPSRELALPWLKDKLQEKKESAELLLNLAHGAPLAALKLLEDDMLQFREQFLKALYRLSQEDINLLKLAAEFSEGLPIKQLDFVLSFMLDLIRLQLGEASQNLINNDFLNELADLKERLLIKNTMRFMHYLQSLRSQIQSGFNLNKQLLVEGIFISWMECV